MNILAVDTSTNVLYVTVHTNNKTIEFNEVNLSSQHSEVLLPKIIEKCAQADISLKDLDLLACTRGPGSFTGLRIAMSCLKGLAYGLGKPLVSVSTLQAYASLVNDFDGAIVVALDAKKQRYYLAVFEVKDGIARRVSEDIDGNAPDLKDILSPYKKIGVIGPDKDVFKIQLDELFDNNKEITVLNTEHKTFNKVLIDLAINQYKIKGADDIGQGPVYIRKSDAEVALEEKRKK